VTAQVWLISQSDKLITIRGSKNKSLLSNLIPKNVNFGDIFRDKILAQNGLNIAGSKSERPLFVRLHFWKLGVE